MIEGCKRRKRWIFLGAASFLWLALRTGSKPSRITYPCQQAALVHSSILFNLILSASTVTAFFKASKHVFRNGFTFVLIFAVVNVMIEGLQPVANTFQEVDIDVALRTASSFPMSDIYVVEGVTYAHIDDLVNLMGSYGLRFYKSDSSGLNMGPDGLIACDDVVLVKMNEEWDQRGGTNTDVIKELIQAVVGHPDGFTGEIVVADNGQWRGSMDYVLNNAEDHDQSTQDVVDMFSGSYKVSTWDWMTIRHVQVDEFSDGDMADGYILYDTADPVTGLYVSYPKFTTTYGTRISFKEGIWNGSGYEQKLKVINMPVLKSHHMYGVTECIKHYMGVESESKFSPGLANGHDTIKYGSMGTLIAELGLPTLNIVDAIWVNAHPEYHWPDYLMGPNTPYSSATRVNILAASIDPVALSYWAAKHVLMPTANALGYSDVRTLDPDNTDLAGQRTLSGELEEAFGVWLPLSRDQLNAAGYNVTTDEDHMNVYTYSDPIHNVAVTNVHLSQTVVAENRQVDINVTVRNLGDFEESFNLTIHCNTTLLYTEEVTLPSRSSTLTTFAWDTTGWSKGSYTIKATAESVPEETTTLDNNYTQNVFITITGDVNGDSKVDLADIYACLILHYGCESWMPCYVANYDINLDGQIDLVDIFTAILHYGESW